jgi:hypothetical protein
MHRFESALTQLQHYWSPRSKTRVRPVVICAHKTRVIPELSKISRRKKGEEETYVLSKNRRRPPVIFFTHKMC